MIDVIEVHVFYRKYLAPSFAILFIDGNLLQIWFRFMFANLNVSQRLDLRSS